MFIIWRNGGLYRGLFMKHIDCLSFMNNPFHQTQCNLDDIDIYWKLSPHEHFEMICHRLQFRTIVESIKELIDEYKDWKFHLRKKS